jgi:hypothetical protein
MAVRVKMEDNFKIYAGTVRKDGKWGSHFDEVTDDAIIAVLNHLLHMNMSGDNQETIQLNQSLSKYGKKKFKVEITFTPEEQ